MSTTNGANGGAHTTPLSAGSAGPASGRLLSAVQSLGVRLRGQRSRPPVAAPPVAGPAATAAPAAWRPAPDAIAGPLGVGGHRASVHPGGRKLAAVAHYRAMADEIARERRLAAAAGPSPVAGPLQGHLLGASSNAAAGPRG
jgi:hypothetical protein